VPQDLQIFPLLPHLSETTPGVTLSPRTRGASTLLVFTKSEGVTESEGDTYLVAVALTIEPDDRRTSAIPRRS
jgi:hypothetical protein